MSLLLFYIQNSTAARRPFCPVSEKKKKEMFTLTLDFNIIMPKSEWPFGDGAGTGGRWDRGEEGRGIIGSMPKAYLAERKTEWSNLMGNQ